MVTMMRLFAAGFALVATAVATLAWTFDEPPAWTAFTGSQTAEVVATRVDETGLRPNWAPVVTVRAGGGAQTDVAGIRAEFTRPNAELVLAQWPVGASRPVRAWDGRLWRAFGGADWFALLLGSAMTLFALVAWGVLLLLLLRGGARAERPS